MSKKDFEWQNAIFGQIEMTNRISKVVMRYSVRNRESKRNFECVNSVFGPNLNVKIGLRMSKCDIQSKFKCQSRISNVNMRYSAPVRMSKHDFES